MDQTIETFVQNKRIAVVGFSRSGKKFGNMAYKELKERGYQVYAVHPQAEQVEGEKCYPNLAALRGMVDGVLMCVPPKRTVEVLREAAEAGIRNVWMQQGSESADAVRLGQELGLQVVSGKCILMYAPPVRSFHGFHRFVMKLIGQL